MNLKPNLLILAGATFAAGLGVALSVPILAGDTEKEEISVQDLPTAVANTVQSELGNKAEEVEKISYEGIVVLYEAEYDKGGKEYEVAIYPNGKLAGRHSHQEEEDKNEEGEEGEYGE